MYEGDGGRGVAVLEGVGGVKGSGADRSCNKKNEKAANNNNKVAMAINIAWFFVKFFSMRIFQASTYARLGPANLSLRNAFATSDTTSLNPIKQ